MYILQLMKPKALFIVMFVPIVTQKMARLPSKIYDSYKFLLSLLQDLGLEISKSKLVEPSTHVVCLGILVDMVNRTISIPPDKLQDIRHICKSWINRNTCTKNQFQSLLGSLLYINNA